MRVAIVGSGIAGNAAAWALTQPYKNQPVEVVMYERRNRVGGHSHTVDVDYDGVHIPVDVGFIVYNSLNYPNLVALFEHLEVETIKSDMSFGASMGGGALEWSGQSLDTVFAQRKNAFSPRFWSMIRDILSFNKSAPLDLAAGVADNMSLGDYLKTKNVGTPFIDDYLLPMGAAIWSTPHADILKFPAANFLNFFNNHRLMHARKDRPKWRTVAGGSRSYVSKIIAPFQEHIRLNAEVARVTSRNGQVEVTDATGHKDSFDHVIFASHTDQTLAAIDNPTEEENRILGDIDYRENDVYLHRDPALMPKKQKIWSSWNYIETSKTHQDEAGVCVSYYMNMLQDIDRKTPLFVSLNPPKPPREDLTFAVNQFAHPQFDAKAIEAQRDLSAIQGKRGLWFCGAWCGYGFHEDGLKAGLDVAEALGAQVPWRSSNDVKKPHLVAAE